MTPATATDRELTLAFQRGENDAYCLVHDRYRARVVALCRRMLGNEHDAQEASQETFLRVYQALGRFNGRYQLGAWIVRIATNVCLDHLRSRRRHPSNMVGDELLELEPCTAPSGDPEDVSIRRSEGRRVRQVLASMPPLHRAALVLRDFEGMSYSEIAVALEITDVQVKALIHRARQRFKRNWTSTGVASWLPWRIVQRLRDPDAVARDQVAQAASSWTPAAASCSAALSSCGHYVSERVAAALTVALVGTAAAASIPAAAPVRSEVENPTASFALETSEERDPVVRGASDHKQPASSEPAPVSAPEQTRTATVPPVEPAPSPSPTEAAPEPEPTQPSGAPNPGPSPTATQPPPPPAFTPTVALGSAASTVAPLDHQANVSCQRMGFTQYLSTQLQRGDEWLPATLEIVAGGVNDYVTLTVSADGRTYRYRSWGSAPSDTWGFDASNGATLVISGSYGPEYGSHPEDAGLPRSGAFTAQLTLECGSSSVITERVDFQD